MTHDEGDFRAPLLHKAMHSVRRIGHNLNFPQEIVEEACHILLCLFLRRFTTRERWAKVKYPRAYIHQSARRALWKAHHRAKKRGPTTPIGSMDPEEIDRLFSPPEKSVDQQRIEEFSANLAEVMKTLTPAEFKAMDSLRRGFTPKIIARLMNTTVETVYTLLSTARKKIRDAWRDSA